MQLRRKISAVISNTDLYGAKYRDIKAGAQYVKYYSLSIGAKKPA